MFHFLRPLLKAPCNGRGPAVGVSGGVRAPSHPGCAVRQGCCLPPPCLLPASIRVWMSPQHPRRESAGGLALGSSEALVSTLILLFFLVPFLSDTSNPNDPGFEICSFIWHSYFSLYPKNKLLHPQNALRGVSQLRE